MLSLPREGAGRNEPGNGGSGAGVVRACRLRAGADQARRKPYSRRRSERPGRDYLGLVTHVKDRPGHDRRYAIDPTKIRGELAWQPAETFESGIAKTVRWYLDNAAWVAAVKSGAYRDWLEVNYAARSAQK